MKTLSRLCPICDGTRGHVLHHQRFAVPENYPLPDRYDLVLCDRCDMLFADTPASQSAYDAFYSTCSIYAQPASAATGATPQTDLARLSVTANLFASQIASKQARILDVGCANGGQLDALGQLGFQNLSGIDPSPACVAHTRKAGWQAYQGDLARLPSGIGLFDAVLLTSVLEHVLNAKSAIAALASLCAPGGRIFLQMPDAPGYANYVNSPYLDISTEHINHFSPTSLRNLMHPFGFGPVLERQLPMHGPAGLRFANLVAVYERQPERGPQTWLRDPSIRSSMERYLALSGRQMLAIDQHLRLTLAASPQIVVWGTGQLTMKLLCDTVLAETRIAAFVDGNPVHAGKRLCGAPILPPDRLASYLGSCGARPDLPIVLGTLLHTEEIRAHIEALGLPNPVVLLHREPALQGPTVYRTGTDRLSQPAIPTLSPTFPSGHLH